MSYETELLFAKSLARQAGELMRTGIESAEQAVWKADNTPVTETDKAINALVIEEVKRVFPDDGILGEEASYEPDRNRKWVVDPIDGTQAFDLGAPVSTFCLGLLVDGVSQLGVVYDPFMDKLYSAVKGKGAYVNDIKLAVSQKEQLQHGYVMLSSRINNEHKTVGQITDGISAAGGKYFNFRSIVYGFMCVAAGKAVGAIAGTYHPWDVVAAQVILDEASATITDLNGDPVDLLDASRGVVVSNGLVHQQLLALVNK